MRTLYYQVGPKSITNIFITCTLRIQREKGKSQCSHEVEAREMWPQIKKC